MTRLQLLLFAALFWALAGCGAKEAPALPESAPAATAPEAPRDCADLASGDDSPRDSLVVMFFGNSLTAGFGLADPTTEAYPALIEAQALAAGLPVRVANAGVSGETTAGGLRRVPWQLQGEAPDVFVLALGGNDALRGLAPDAMQDNLEGILDCVRAARPSARLVVAGMEAPPNLGDDYTARFRAVFPAVAASTDAALVPFLLEGVGGVDSLNQSDGIHPTAEGQRVLAETVWRVLGPVLREAVGPRS